MSSQKFRQSETDSKYKYNFFHDERQKLIIVLESQKNKLENFCTSSTANRTWLWILDPNRFTFATLLYK